ncbi:MAG: ATP-binding cassette domain-containing protein [Firmicutes bacterium]|nr:ATP-binding cassette domain-containing protein [Bacillota bacterium]
MILANDVPGIEFVHVSKTKPVLLGDSIKELEVMRDISLSLGKGEILAPIGPSGSGKSTLLRMINRMEDPTLGSILLFGQDIAGLNVRELRRRVGMVSQTPALLPGTVADNIAYGPSLRGQTCDVAKYLKLVDLEADLLQRPASALSIGQQQRMCIARALANEPEILLLDEPTSGLDQTAAHKIVTLLSVLNRDLGLTLIMVTHLMEHAEAVATQVALLVKGQLVEQSSADEFFLEPVTEIGRKFLRGELSSDEH